MVCVMTKIIIGELAGHHFHGQADLSVARHATRIDDHGSVVSQGFLIVRKRLVNRSAYDYDPTFGWETDQYFEWLATPTASQKEHQ